MPYQRIPLKGLLCFQVWIKGLSFSCSLQHGNRFNLNSVHPSMLLEPNQIGAYKPQGAYLLTKKDCINLNPSKLNVHIRLHKTRFMRNWSRSRRVVVFKYYICPSKYFCIAYSNETLLILHNVSNFRFPNQFFLIPSLPITRSCYQRICP